MSDTFLSIRRPKPGTWHQTTVNRIDCFPIPDNKLFTKKILSRSLLNGEKSEGLKHKDLGFMKDKNETKSIRSSELACVSFKTHTRKVRLWGKGLDGS